MFEICSGIVTVGVLLATDERLYTFEYHNRGAPGKCIHIAWVSATECVSLFCTETEYLY